MFLIKDSKSPYFQLVYFVNGKRTKISTKTSDKKRANRFLASFNPQEAAVIKARKNLIKLSSFITEYKNYVSNTYSVSYLKKAVTPSFNMLQNFLKDMPLENISSKNIDQFISSVYAKSKFAASLYHRTLKAAFSKAVVWNYIQENPFNKIKSPKVAKSFPAYFSETELIEILNKTDEKLYRDIFTTAFYTGMRLNEIMNMKWNWIDFSHGIITIKNSNEFNTKNKRERVIPIHPKVSQTLKTYLQFGNQVSCNFVFYHKKGIKLNGEFISKQLKMAVRSAELNDNIHFHSLRHSFSSALVQRGVSLYAVKELLGHENIKTTQIYSHLQTENLYKAVNLL